MNNNKEFAEGLVHITKDFKIDVPETIDAIAAELDRRDAIVKAVLEQNADKVLAFDEAIAFDDVRTLPERIKNLDATIVELRELTAVLSREVAAWRNWNNEPFDPDSGILAVEDAASTLDQLLSYRSTSIEELAKGTP